MATPIKSLEYPVKYPDISQALKFRIGLVKPRTSVIVMVILLLLSFATALYYVNQQLQLQTLNYEIIELKQQKKTLLEQQRTYQLQLHQLTRLDRIEEEMKKQGFLPVAEEQIRVIR